MRRRTAVVSLYAVAIAAMTLGANGAASAAAKAGDAKVVTPPDNTAQSRPLDHGTAATAFSLQLPVGASCPGDSANGQYKVQSYMVPAAVDPASLQFGSVGPIPVATGTRFREPLFDLNTNPYSNAQTAAATRPHGPGPIINIPGFNFSVFKAGDIPPGVYNAGIACTKGPAGPSQLDTFWNTQIVIASAGQLAWSTPGAGPPPAAASPGSGSGAATAVSAARPSNGSTIGGGDAGAPQSAGRTGPSTLHPEAAKATGAPPSFGNPFGEVRALIPTPSASAIGVVAWVIVALVVVRIAMLLLSRRTKDVGAPITFELVREDR